MTQSKKNHLSKILLITPPYHAGVVESAGSWMPLSLAVLAGSLSSYKHYDIQIYDAMSKQHDWGKVKEELATRNFDVIAISAITSTFPEAFTENPSSTLPFTITVPKNRILPVCRLTSPATV